MNRRNLFKMTGLSVSSIFLGEAVAHATTQSKPFQIPTSTAPLLLCFNENPLGISEAAKQAMSESAKRASRYPFAQVAKMRKLCAKFMGGSPDNIMLSHGSAEAIRASVEAFKTDNTVLLTAELTYSDGADVARRNNIPVEVVKMGPNWSIDVEAMRKKASQLSKTKSVLVYFVNPNNPTSTIADTKAVFEWVKSKPQNTMFIVDEAYAEFVSDPSFRSLKDLVLDGYNNLVVLKTFSKIFAMAGLRLGFAFGTKEVVDRVRNHVAYEMMMNQATLAVATAELQDPEFLKVSRRMNEESRTILCRVLDQLNVSYLPSQTNFVFIDLKDKSLADFSKRMKDENILVGRPFPPANTWCRISLGTPDEMRYFTSKLIEFRKKGWI